MELFRQYSLSQVIEEQTRKMNLKVEAFTNDEILSNSLEVLADNLYEEFYIEPICIGEEEFAKRSVEQEKIERSIDPLFRRIYGRDSIEVDGIVATFYFPFTGDEKLFSCQASTFSMSGYPDIDIRNGFISFCYERTLQDMERPDAKEQINNSLKNDLEHIKAGVGYVNKDVNMFNGSLLSNALAALQTRKKKIESFHSISALLEVPIEKNEYSVTHVPLTRRITPIQHTYHSASNFYTRHNNYERHFKYLSDTSIPIPPIEVQREIVRILDNFTELTAELTVELTVELEAREKQYEYYRNLLLTFDDNHPMNERIKEVCPRGVAIKTLGDLGSFYGGLSGKSKDDFKNGNAKFISYMNVYSNPGLKTDVSETVKIGENEKQNTIQYGDVLFTGSSETPDECGMSSVLTIRTTEKLYLNSFCFGYRFNDIAAFNPDFLKHLFRSVPLRKQIGKTANGVTRFNVSKEKMKKIAIPVPPLSIQEAIVHILDNFSALTTDLSHGLPAEIEARKKQYEHYRDKLLAFKEKKVDENF